MDKSMTREMSYPKASSTKAYKTISRHQKFSQKHYMPTNFIILFLYETAPMLLIYHGTCTTES